MVTGLSCPHIIYICGHYLLRQKRAREVRYHQNMFDTVVFGRMPFQNSFLCERPMISISEENSLIV